MNKTKTCDKKTRRNATNINKLHHADGPKKIVAQLTRANHFLKLKVVVSATNLSEQDANQSVMNHSV